MFSEMLEINNINGVNFGTASNVYQVYDTTNDSDVFELVIDGLILEKYADEDVKEYIKHLPSNKKRVATLVPLGEDNLLWSKINDIIKEEKSSYERLKSVYTLLKDYVKIADVERKKHGEILTPFKELAEPMVKLVEKYDREFWKNKNHKVLDSSAGYGTFLILSAYKFMVGLKDEFPDEEERFKWIVENCLYYGELQAKSVFSWLVAIDPHNEYKTNIYWGSFLTKDFDEHMKNVWKVESFDLIIQNPPYQEQKEGFTKTQPIWHLFVEKSINILNSNKYLVMIHPNGWRNIDGIFKNIQTLIRSRQLLEINNFSETQSLKLFNASIFFDYYILRNSMSDIITKVINSNSEESEMIIKEMEFIPDGNNVNMESLLAKDNEEKVTILHSFSAYETRKPFISKTDVGSFKYKCISNVTRSGYPKFVYSSVNHRGHFGIPKLVCGMASSGSNFYEDIDGSFGMTQFAFGIVDNAENITNIKKALESTTFQEIIKSIPNNSSAINYKILMKFKKDFWKKFI